MLKMLRPAPLVENEQHHRLGELRAVIVGDADDLIHYGLISHLCADGRRVWMAFPIGDFHKSAESKELVLDVPIDLLEFAPAIDLPVPSPHQGADGTVDPLVLEIIDNCVA